MGKSLEMPRCALKGGADTTSLAIYQYVEWLSRHYSPAEYQILLFKNQVVERAFQIMSWMWSDQTGISTGFADISKQSLVSLKSGTQQSLPLRFMKIRFADPAFGRGDELICKCLEYLATNGDRWRQDETNLFGMWAAILEKVRELIK